MGKTPYDDYLNDLFGSPDDKLIEEATKVIKRLMHRNDNALELHEDELIILAVASEHLAGDIAQKVPVINIRQWQTIIQHVITIAWIVRDEVDNQNDPYNQGANE